MDDIPKNPGDPVAPAATPSEPVSPSGWVKEDPVPAPDVTPQIPQPVEMKFSPLTESRPDQPQPGSPSQEVPNSPQPQPPGPSTQEVIQTRSSGGGGGFKTFVIIGLVIILGIWAAAGYLYMQNQNLKGKTQEAANALLTTTPSPTPAFSPEQVKIKSGSVVWEKPDGTSQVLIDKESYESTGITGFLKVSVSPDNSKMCFESWPPAPEPALYISGIDGQNVVEASPNRQNCLWSPDSTKIYYINSASKSAPVNIFSYVLETKEETDLTGDSVPSGIVRQYEIVGLSADATKMICKYEDAGGAAATDNVHDCEIDLETGEVNSLSE